MKRSTPSPEDKSGLTAKEQGGVTGGKFHRSGGRVWLNQLEGVLAEGRPAWSDIKDGG